MDYSDDLDLARRVARGEPDAIKRFDREVAGEIVASVRYRGAGPLHAWVAITALRLALNDSYGQELSQLFLLTV